jgi:hypothetical protein
LKDNPGLDRDIGYRSFHTYHQSLGKADLATWVSSSNALHNLALEDYDSRKRESLPLDDVHDLIKGASKQIHHMRNMVEPHLLLR